MNSCVFISICIAHISYSEIIYYIYNRFVPARNVKRLRTTTKYFGILESSLWLFRVPAQTSTQYIICSVHNPRCLQETIFCSTYFLPPSVRKRIEIFDIRKSLEMFDIGKAIQIFHIRKTIEMFDVPNCASSTTSLGQYFFVCLSFCYKPAHMWICLYINSNDWTLSVLFAYFFLILEKVFSVLARHGIGRIRGSNC